VGLPQDAAQANTDLLRKIVKLEPKSEPVNVAPADAVSPAGVAAVWNAEVVEDDDSGGWDPVPDAPAPDPAAAPAPTADGTPTIAPTPAVASGAGVLTQWPHIGGGDQKDASDLAPLLVP
jgi:hypothetical protein